MIRNKKLIFSLTAGFLAVMTLLGVLLQTAQDVISVNLRYTAVIVACLFFVLFAERTLSFAFTLAALIFTLAADYFLVYLPEIKQLPAMICFSLVQLAYFARLFCEDENRRRRTCHAILHAVLSLLAIVLTLLVLGESCDAVALVSMFYYANLILNVIFACGTFFKNPIFALGLLLFLCCDTVIGLIFVKHYLPIASDSFLYKILYPGFDLAWAFYVPSQALLAISLLPNFSKRAEHRSARG